MNLELRHLRVVCAIAETGSVTKAASLLGLAQPALTAQLQRIERTLGGPLFDRDRRGARPTALGELVLSRAKVLLPAMKGLQDEAARLAGVSTGVGRYRIGAVDGSVLGGLVHRLAADLPEAQISTYPSGRPDELAHMVVGGRLDFAIIGMCGHPGPVVDFGISWRQIALDAVHVLMSTRHPLAGREELDLAELAGAQWVARAGDTCFGDCFAAACSRAGFTPGRIFEVDERACVDIVDSGDAVGLCQPTFRPVPGLVMRPLTGAPLRWRQLIGWHSQSDAAGMAESVHRYAVDAYQEAIARNPGYLRWIARNPAFGPVSTPVG
ncbi:LysR family transcriptional regulator [Pilimelia terevasa]|uniref:LysR family transcriptional regulator n=1 Tax=Pilimelia terevasa TaxID=53372 RepID=A0A8J3FJR4_9ACTN|nr:LysR family transcriptional regulator [Pilimelia terevasa]GGK42244.1 LysR family transcriptional regulator [Pilimelia terevasa]